MASPTGKKSVEALASNSSLKNWKIEMAVEFIALPKEKEEAYWNAIAILAEIYLEILTVPAAELETAR